MLQRDLNTSVLAEEIAAGTRCIYVDYVDYDEIAHHAGIFRPESLASLDGLDRVLATLERLAERAPRRYHLVVLSDHGQSQGEPFAARFGIDLGDLCADLMAQDVQSVDPTSRAGGARVPSPPTSPEPACRARWPPGPQPGSTRRWTRASTMPPRRRSACSARATSACSTCTARAGSRWRRSTSRWPALVPGLSSHEGVGFVAGMDAEGRRWVIGADGRRDLETGAVTGVDPLAPYAAHAGEVLARALAMPEAPDLYLNSSVDPTTHDIAAFEPLVGAHGGLGGWQDRAVLLVPKALEHVVPEETVVGADRLHQVLVSMLESLGHRGQ